MAGDIRRVLVVGGGVGGLTAAATFARRGVEVVLIERRPAFDIPGIGLGQPANALRVYDTLGVLEEMLATGFSYDRARRREQATVAVEVLPQVRDIRRLGAAATDLCHLAAGRFDGFYERALNLWDVAAGGLVAAEAGACITGVAGVDPGVSDPWLGTRGDLVGVLHGVEAADQEHRSEHRSCDHPADGHGASQT